MALEVFSSEGRREKIESEKEAEMQMQMGETSQEPQTRWIGGRDTLRGAVLGSYRDCFRCRCIADGNAKRRMVRKRCARGRSILG